MQNDLYILIIKKTPQINNSILKGIFRMQFHVRKFAKIFKYEKQINYLIKQSKFVLVCHLRIFISFIMENC